MPPPPNPLFQKFPLHSPALTALTSPLVLANSGPTVPLPVLSDVRAMLEAERTVAKDRLAIRDLNRRTLAERAAHEKKMADDKAREKEVERKRKREEDDRRERERVERVEREREDRERGERDEKKRVEDAYELAKAKEEEEKRVADEREREAAIRRARELKEREVRDATEAREAREAKDRDKAKVVQVQQVLQIVRENEADRANEVERAVKKEAAIEASAVPPPPVVAASLPPPIDNDVVMADPPTLPAPSTLPVPPPSPLASAPTTLPPPPPTALVTEIPPVDIQAVSAPLDRVPSIRIVSSPEPDDDDPLPPLRHKSSDKKKRKRDQILDSDASDSDDPTAQPLLQKIRKLGDQTTASLPGPASPASSSSLSTLAPLSHPTPSAAEPPPSPPRDPYEGLTPLQRKLKEEKFIKHSIPTRPPATGTAQAFYLSTHSLVPPKPISVPPTPTPKKQSEVSEDFSKAKPGTQITHNTFHTWVEAYLRPFGEDDLAFLAPKPEDGRAYDTPDLGKYYTDGWDEEDSEAPVASTSYVSPLEPPVLPRLRPEALTEDALGMENVFLGPLSERLVAALAFDEPGEMSDVRDKVERDDDGVPTTKLAIMDAVDLEERIKKELRFIGLLEEEDVDWSTRADDEVSSALRACQQLLQRQTALNEARKSILSGIVKDRMAYQDYEATRDAQERVIENGWTKRQRAGKKKGKGKERDKPTEGPKPPVSLALLSAVEKRRKLVSHLKPFFEEEEDAGRFYGIPERSVYEGLGIDGEGLMVE